jgi:hypothetical protein
VIKKITKNFAIRCILYCIKPVSKVIDFVAQKERKNTSEFEIIHQIIIITP